MFRAITIDWRPVRSVGFEQALSTIEGWSEMDRRSRLLVFDGGMLEVFAYGDPSGDDGDPGEDVDGEIEVAS
ncbi:hypothetical protein [Nocardia sp. NPDC051570]|uniref:hypothetical protein n=1 Tax=Nocardia sp. NPDC051570 TaxID=3364324 RepID=UPI0037ACB1C4